MAMDMQNNEPKQEEVKNEKTQNGAAVVAIIMGCIMVTIYMGMAVLLLFTNLFIGKVPEWVRFLMGAVFFVYGIYRAYRIIKSHR
jgi:Na+/glutamate symporter